MPVLPAGFCSDGDGDLGSDFLRIVTIIHAEIIKANLSRLFSYFFPPALLCRASYPGYSLGRTFHFL
jgi:hypothetical protein